MTDAARYVKLVEWSERDGAFVGRCPGIIGPCCHGLDEVEVYRELCGIVEEWIAIARRGGQPLPPPTAGADVAREIACTRPSSPVVQKESAAMTSPPWVVLRARQARMWIESLMKRTEPSARAALTPPGWRLRAP